MTSSEPPAVLFLVVGPSGAGKDTLIDHARAALEGSSGFVFPRRTITRKESIGEDHDSVSEVEFLERERNGEFFLSWAAHGFRYGVPVTNLAPLRQGNPTVINVSRRVIDEARQKWARTETIAVEASREALLRRLVERGRESEDEIAERVERAWNSSCEISGPFHAFDNSPPLSQTAPAFVNLLRSLAQAPVQ